MQLDELQQHWQQLDQKLDRTLAMGTELMRQSIMQPARRRMNWQAFWPALDIVFCFCILLPTGNIIYQHGQNGRVLFPALVTMLSAIALLATSIQQLQLISELNWEGPVANIQTTLEKLKVAKIKQFKWIILLSPLAGFCGLVVLLHGVLAWLSQNRFSLMDQFNQNWLIANYIFSFAFILIGQLLASYLASKCQHHRWWQAVLDDISGKSLITATLDLKKWEAFS